MLQGKAWQQHLHLRAHPMGCRHAVWNVPKTGTHAAKEAEHVTHVCSHDKFRQDCLSWGGQLTRTTLALSRELPQPALLRELAARELAAMELCREAMGPMR